MLALPLERLSFSPLLKSYSPSPIFPQRMLTLSKKTDYALISLAYLAGREGGLASAREIALAADLPLPLLMQILKTLHQRDILHSTRGVKGGYRLSRRVESISLLGLIRLMDGETSAAEMAPLELPLRAMRRKLAEFLDQVNVIDIIRPGRRIDVPVESVRVIERNDKQPASVVRQVFDQQVQPA